jgi:hypothetical protein
VSDDNPFEELDEAVEGREDNPFDRLGYPEEERSTEGSRLPWGEPLEPDTLDESERVQGVESGDTATDPEPSADRPVGEDLQEGPASDASRAREGDPFKSMGEAFTEMEVEGVDPDEVWQRLSDAGEGSDTRETGRSYAEVSKHSYCEQCEYFSDPPDVECSHEGTEIVEFLDIERVRVVDCPVVAERKNLEGE